LQGHGISRAAKIRKIEGLKPVLLPAVFPGTAKAAFLTNNHVAPLSRAAVLAVSKPPERIFIHNRIGAQA
jgi:hypothetical protein